MKFSSFLFLAFVGICSAHASSLYLTDSSGFPNNLQGRDFFFVSESSESSTTLRNTSLEDCRANIAKVICLVNPTGEQEKIPERRCLPSGEAYVNHFESLFDNYPPGLQRMFCSLKHIYIENEFFGTAYAGLITGPDGKKQGAMIGIRRAVLDERLDFTTWASWKEQLSFGGISGNYRAVPDLPVVHAKTYSRTNDFLYFVISHEFGHLFDFANDLNKTAKCKEANGDEEPN